jgi:hypothetical protein
VVDLLVEKEYGVSALRSKLYAEALEKGWFRIDPEDYERFDMKEPVMSAPDVTPLEMSRICDEIYKVFLSPQ